MKIYNSASLFTLQDGGSGYSLNDGSVLNFNKSLTLINLSRGRHGSTNCVFLL